MQQDLEEEKNKAIIQDLTEKVENHEANQKKKDFVIQDLEIMVKEHEGALEKKDFVIHSLICHSHFGLQPKSPPWSE